MSTVHSSEQSIVERTTELFEEVVQEVFQSRKEAYILYIMDRLRGRAAVAPGDISAPSSDEPWIEIESLSRLRSVVGGRFQNIRKKWLGAGLPLREHRGDKQDEYEIVAEGWVELSNWILKQGYEARTTNDKTGCVIELRKLSE